MSYVNGDTISNVRIEPVSPIIQTKQVARDVNGQHIEVLVMGYSDRIMINVITEGKLGQLVNRISSPLIQALYILVESASYA
jgi:hypothetical protein